MDSMTLGAEIDNVRAQLLKIIEAARAREKTLIEAGCLKAHIHFKAKRSVAPDGTVTVGLRNIMYMYLPADARGHRKYIHVGVDPKKQAEKRAQVEREALRSKIERDRQALEHQVEALTWELQSLKQRYESVLAMANEVKGSLNDRS